MTTGSPAKEASGSASGNAIEDELIATKKVSNDAENASSVKKGADVDQTRVLDENFRLTVKKMLTGIAELPDNWNCLTVREQRDWVYLKMKGHCPNIPDSMLHLHIGYTMKGDCGQPSTALPDWLDSEKFRRGQRFASNNFASVSISQLLALYLLFSFRYSLRPLLFTGKSNDPFNAFKRYLSTLRYLWNWYSSDVLTAGTVGYKDIQAVRKMHANIRKKMDDMTYLEVDEAATIRNTWSNTKAKIREDFRDSCQERPPGQCPYLLNGGDQSKRTQPLNTFEMSATQFSFMGMVILYPKNFGIHGASDEDLDDFCHLWRGLGYLLGIEDEFNFCRGTLEEVKQRSRDFIDYWIKPNLRDISPEWEHMMRCIIEGINYCIYKSSYDHWLLYIADVIGIPMPRLRASLSYVNWIYLNLMKFTLNWIARLPGVPAAINLMVKRSTDRAFEYTDKELAVLQQRSKIALSKGIAETIAVEKNVEIATPNVLQKAPFLVFLLTFLLLSLSIIVGVYQKG